MKTKKIIAAVLAAAAASAVCAPAFAENYEYSPAPAAYSNPADIDGNGSVNVRDVTQLLKLIASGSKDIKYDVNGDGKLTIADATSLLNTVLGKIDINIPVTSGIYFDYEKGHYWEPVEVVSEPTGPSQLVGLPEPNSIIIKAYTGTDPKVCVPEKLDGLPVRFISMPGYRSDDIIDRKITDLVLPGTVSSVNLSGLAELKTLAVKGSAKEGYLNISNCPNLSQLQVAGNFVSFDIYNWDCLTKINVPGSAKTVSISGENVSSVSLPSGAEEVYIYADELTSISIPNGVKTLSLGCEKLSSVSVPASVTALNCRGCTNLVSVNIPKGITKLVEYSYNDKGECSLSYSGVINVVIPESVTTIESGAFTGCKNLKSVTIPSGLKSLAKDAFDSDCGAVFTYKGKNYQGFMALYEAYLNR